MKQTLKLFCVCCAIAGASNVLAGAISRSSTGTSTETSTSTSSTSSTGSCTGDSTAAKTTSASDTTLISGCTVIPPDVDDDGDGMISSWETANTLQRYDATDKLLDLDSDHISNLVEYLRGLTANDDDTDDDSVIDGDDIDPSSALQGALSVDGVYDGSQITDTVEKQ